MISIYDILGKKVLEIPLKANSTIEIKPQHTRFM